MAMARKKNFYKSNAMKISPRILIPRPGMFNKEAIEQYEREILCNTDVDEIYASYFFARFPQFLLFGTSAEIRREVCIYHADGTSIGRLDFFRREYGNAYWDIIEVKHPNAPIIVNIHSNHPRPSSDVYAAINQAQDYQEWIDNDTQVREQLLKNGILAYKPKAYIIIGKDNNDIAPRILREMFNRVSSGVIEVKSYSDLWNFAKEYYESHKIIMFRASIGTKREDFINDSLLIEPVVKMPENEIVIRDQALIMPQHNITVGRDATIHARIHGKTIVVYGKVYGDIIAEEKVELSPESSLEGNIYCPKVIILEGAMFKGSVDLRKK